MEKVFKPHSWEFETYECEIIANENDVQMRFSSTSYPSDDSNAYDGEYAFYMSLTGVGEQNDQSIFVATGTAIGATENEFGFPLHFVLSGYTCCTDYDDNAYEASVELKLTLCSAEKTQDIAKQEEIDLIQKHGQFFIYSTIESLSKAIDQMPVAKLPAPQSDNMLAALSKLHTKIANQIVNAVL